MRTGLKISPRLGAVLLLLVAMTSIQMGASVAKGLFPKVGAEGATALRLAFAAGIMALFGRPWRARLTRANAPALLGYGAALGAMNLSFYVALQTVPLGIAVALEFLGPLTVSVLGSRRPMDLLWVALAALGLVLLLLLRTAGALLDLKGVAFALLAGICWGLYIVLGQKAGAAHGVQTVAVGSLVAAVVAVPFGVAHAGTKLLDPSLLPLALTVGLMSSALPYSMEMVALTRLPTRVFGVLMSGEPALAALMGWIVLGERLSPVQFVGVACVMAASLGSVMTDRPAPAVMP